MRISLNGSRQKRTSNFQQNLESIMIHSTLQKIQDIFFHSFCCVQTGVSPSTIWPMTSLRRRRRRPIATRLTVTATGHRHGRSDSSGKVYSDRGPVSPPRRTRERWARHRGPFTNCEGPTAFGRNDDHRKEDSLNVNPPRLVMWVKQRPLWLKPIAVLVPQQHWVLLPQHGEWQLYPHHM